VPPASACGRKIWFQQKNYKIFQFLTGVQPTQVDIAYNGYIKRLLLSLFAVLLAI